MKAGFTLIELLIVIAIIGILSSIVLSSLNSARAGANDAAIKTMMKQMQSQAEIYRVEKGSYYGTDTNGEFDDSMGECFVGAPGSVFIDDTSSNDLEELIRAAEDISDDAGARIKCRLGGLADDRWALAFPTFDGGSGTGWCVDSSGNSKAITHNFDSAGIIPIVCP